MDWDCPHCDFVGDSYKSYSAHHRYNHDGNALADYVDPELLADMYERMSELELSEQLGVSRDAVGAALEHVGVERRGQSESIQHMQDRMSAEERMERVKAAHRARRKDPQLSVNANGYPVIRHQGHTVKHHRLIATLLVDDLTDLEGMHVHHDLPIWQERSDEVNHAVTYLDNLEVLPPREHHQEHYEQRKVGDDGLLK